MCGLKGAYLETRTPQHDVVAPVLLSDYLGDSVPSHALRVWAEELFILHREPQTPLVAQRRARGDQSVDVRLAGFLQPLRPKARSSTRRS